MAEKETKYGCEEKESTPKAVKNASIVTDDELDSLLDGKTSSNFTIFACMQ